MADPERRTWTGHRSFLRADERLFAVLWPWSWLGGLATLDWRPFARASDSTSSPWLLWFAAYKVCILAWVTSTRAPRRKSSPAALAVDMLLVFALLYLTGGGDSPYATLF